MTIEENKKLLEEHPIFRPSAIVGFPGESEKEREHREEVIRQYDYSWTTLDLFCIGWRKLALEMADELEKHLKEVGHLDEFCFFDVKEKWGSLRISVDGYTDDIIDGIVSKYEFKSFLVCPFCGKPTTKITDGYVLYICDECSKDPDLKLTFRDLTPEDRPKVVWTMNKGEKHIEEPFKEEFIKQWGGGGE